MANELLYVAATGGTYYGIVQANPGNQFANGVVLENYNVSHWANYAIALADTHTIGQYLGTFPILGDARYRVFYYRQAGGSPATSDAPAVSTENVFWDGASQLYGDAVELALSQKDIVFMSLTAGGQTIPDQITIDHGTGSYLSTGPAIGGAFARTLTFNDTNGDLITASPFSASITNGVITEVHSASTFTTSLGAGVFGVAAVAPGYTFTPTTLTVSASGSSTYQMTPIVISPPISPTDCTLYFYTVDQSGSIVQNSPVRWCLKVYNSDVVVINGQSDSDDNGLWTLDVEQGSGPYQMTTAANVVITVPAANTTGSTFQIA